MKHHLFFAHLVWTTRNRERLITLRLAEFLRDYLPATAFQERAHLRELGMVTTHVHLLLRLDVATDIPRMVQRMKGGSARLAARDGHNGTDPPLRWAKGYGLTVVSDRALDRVAAYVREQEQRHPQEKIPGWTWSPLPLQDRRYSSVH